MDELSRTTATLVDNLLNPPRVRVGPLGRERATEAVPLDELCGDMAELRRKVLGDLKDVHGRMLLEATDLISMPEFQRLPSVIP